MAQIPSLCKFSNDSACFDVHHVQKVISTLCKGLPFFHVYYVQTMYAAVTNQEAYIARSLGIYGSVNP